MPGIFIWAAGGSWMKSLLEMRDLGLTNSVLVGQSLLYLHGGKTLWTEKVKL